MRSIPGGGNEKSENHKQITSTTKTITIMTKLTTLATIHKLAERYPFNDEELEILVRCHEHLEDNENKEDFLMKLAVTSPYSYFFLPGDEMRDRVNFIEDKVLPAGFASDFRAAISADAFVEYANQGTDKKLERFLEGIADTGRRGNKEALSTLYNIVGGSDPSDAQLIDCAVRLAVASDVLVAPLFNKQAILKQVQELEPIIQSLTDSLQDTHRLKPLTKKDFISWAEDDFPLLSTPLSTFVHNLLFHGHPYPEGRIPLAIPKLDHMSDIFKSPNSPFLTALAFMAPTVGGKWRRLYTSEMDGRSFNRLEWSLLGYAGPTLLVIKATDDSTLGAFTAVPWKEARGFYGNTDCFIFELEPKIGVHRPMGTEDHFMYLHSHYSDTGLLQQCRGRPHGIGFGGSLEQPRLFIPESLEGCHAHFLDKTFESGELLPLESLEKFEIKYLEIWGVGGDDVVTRALRERAEYRERTDTTILKARTVEDKSIFVVDMKSGLIPNKLFAEAEQARGRHDFVVDDEHGGYKVDRK